ncbi:MAG: hypothetical protein HUJ31_19210 [Pseudomonadales bacterium]|nr:hypothetical protein [Pseudomonadales bacterium]
MNTISGLKMALALSLPLMLGVGPCERMPGGVLNGPVASAPVDDWSALNEDLGLCAIESRPAFPHSVTVACWREGPDLYVGCMSCDGKMWSDYISADPRARIKIGETVYPVHMNRIVDRSQMQGPWEARLAARGVDTDRPIPESYWLWRLTSRP